MLELLSAGAMLVQQGTHSWPVVCLPTEQVQQVIIKHEEELTWSTKTSAGHIVSLWYNKTSKSYTIIVTTKTGEVSCILSSGDPVI